MQGLPRWINRRDYLFIADITPTILFHFHCGCSIEGIIHCHYQSLMERLGEMRTAPVIVVIFFLSFLSMYSADMFDGHFGLVANVHKYFGTSSIFVVHSRQESLEEFYRIEKLIRHFSAENIFVVTVEFRRLKEAMSFYSKRIVRSLIVVNLRNRELVAKFSNLTSYFDMHASYWLLIFDEEAYLQTNPTERGENIFHISFDTEMLVARNNHSTIQEWYWLKNRIKMEDLAEWNIDTGFKLETDGSLYERRVNLENSPIVVTAFDNPPMTRFVNKTIGGLFGIILKELSRAANFDIIFISPDEMTYGSWNAEKEKWTGLIGTLVDGKASIAAGDFTITTARQEGVDFTLPIISSYDKLYIKKPNSGIRWSSYWETLDSGIWIVIQLLILFTTLLLTVISAVRRYKITINVFAGYLLLVFGIYCQQGLPEFPTDLPSRIAYFSIFLSALIVSAAYAAALVSFLTVTGTTLPFTSLEEFVDDGTYSLIVFRDGAEYDMFMSSTDSILAQMSLMMKDRAALPISLQDGFLQVCNGKVAFYVASALEEAIRASVPCEVVGIGLKRSVSLAMALSKGNSFNGLINYHVQKFRDHGILNRLKNEFGVAQNPSASQHTEVSLWGVLPILAVLGGGLIFAIFILCLEIFFYRKQLRESIKAKDRWKLASRRSKEILKIRLRNRTKYSTASSNFYP